MTDIEELVKGLRVLAEVQTGMGTSEPEDHIAWEAADEIERLRAELAAERERANDFQFSAQTWEMAATSLHTKNAKLRKAMRPISLWSFEAQDGSPAIKELHDDILRVRAALKGEKR